MEGVELPAPWIDSYQFGSIVIDGRVYRKDVIVTPDGVIPDWWRERGHSLSMDDLSEGLESQPEQLIVGTGRYSCMKVPEETQSALLSSGIKVHILAIDEACERYNAQVHRGRLVAALHLTC